MYLGKTFKIDSGQSSCPFFVGKVAVWGLSTHNLEAQRGLLPLANTEPTET